MFPSPQEEAGVRLARLTALGLLTGVGLYLLADAVGLISSSTQTDHSLGAAVIIGVSLFISLGGRQNGDRGLPKWAYQTFPPTVAAVVVGVGVASEVTPIYLVAGAGLLALAGTVGGPAIATTIPIVAALPIVAIVRDGAATELGVGSLAVYVIVVLTQRATRSVLSEALRDEVEERDRAQRLAWHLEAVARGARAVTALQVDDVMQAVADTATATDWQTAALYLVDAEHPDRLRIAGHSNLPASMAEVTVALGQGLAGRAVANGATVETADYRSWEGRLSSPGAERLRAAAATPVRTENGIVGAIAVGRFDRRGIDHGSLIALELLAAQAGRALELSARDQQQLRTIDRLRRVEERQSSFLSAVSHEVRTPVTVVLGATETLAERWDRLTDTQRRSLLRQAHLNAHALGRLVSALLDGARLREGDLRIATSDVPLDRLVTTTVERLRPILRDLTIEMDVPEGVSVTADPDLLARVLENLLTNAGKYAGKDARVGVHASVQGGEVVVSVTDDGPGLSEESVRHLGERFYRGEHRGGKIPGVGLGISFCQQVLDCHGSTLEVASTPDVATTFSFRLPVATSVREH